MSNRSYGCKALRNTKSSCSLAKHAVHELHARRTFADRCGDSFDTAGPHVTHGEDAWAIGLKEIRFTRQGPMTRLSIAPRLRTGTNEAFVVEIDAAFKPASIRNRAHHQEHMTDLVSLCFARLV